MKKPLLHAFSVSKYLLLLVLFLGMQTGYAQQSSKERIRLSQTAYDLALPEGKVHFAFNDKKVIVKLKAGVNPMAFFRQNSALFAPYEADWKVPFPEVYRPILRGGGKGYAQDVARLEALADVEYVAPVVKYRGLEQSLYDLFFVKLKKAADLSLLEAQARDLGFRIGEKKDGNIIFCHVSKTSAGNSFEVAARLQSLRLFAFAEPDFIYTCTPGTTDPYYSWQWFLNNTGSSVQYSGTPGADMRVAQAWNTTTGDTSIKVAVLDCFGSAAQFTHPDLTFAATYDAAGTGFVSSGFTGDAHGICCAGLIKATANNNLGGAGIAYNAGVVAVKLGTITNSSGSWNGTGVSISNGITWAYQNTDVISNSNTFGSSSSLINTAIANGLTSGRGGKGTLFFSSAGNSNTTTIGYPASNANTVAVAATSMCDQRKNPASCDGETWWGSDYGTGVDIGAPGVKMYTTDLPGTAGYSSNDYAPTFNGTSSACPAAAAVMALILSANPNLSASSARAILESTCAKVGGYTYNTGVSGQPNGTWCTDLGYGRVDASAALASMTNCAGTPTGGTAAANGATGTVGICPTNAIVLTATGSASTGLSYQWQYSASGTAGSYTNISGATLDFYTISTYTTANAGYYQRVVTCANGGASATSAPVQLTTNTAAACYCTPNTTDATVYNITNFTTTGAATNINNTSAATTGYENFSATVSASALTGTTVNYSMTVSGGNTYGRAIWIDLNENGSFMDAGEQVVIGTGYFSSPLTGSFLIPAGTAAGTKRMRIVASYIPANPGDPCTLGNAGEYEDYSFVVLVPTPCTGTPGAPTATAAVANACTSIPFTLNATSPSPAGTTGLGYQWQSAPAGTNTFANISGATTVPYTLPAGQTAASNYRLLLTCTNAGGGTATSNTVSVGMNSYQNCYCTPVYTTGCSGGTLISNFAIGTFSNNSGTTCSTSPLAFSDYTGGAQVQLALNTNYTATLTTGSGGAAAGAAIWIDYNDDGFFTASERSVTPANIAAGSSGTIILAVGANAPLGLHRMRVRLVRDTVGTSIDACGTDPLGEAEDYTANIVSTIPCSATPGVPAASASAASVCSAAAFTLSATGLPPASTSGITYQWQSALAGGSTFSNISGAVTSTYSVSAGQTVATDYRLLVTCTNAGGGTATSNTVSVGINAPATCFCVPTTTGAATYSVTNFTTTGGVANINNTSSGTSGYQNFFALVAAVSAYPGNAVSYSMTVAGNDTYGRAIWIDFNENGLFTDAGEQVASSTAYAASPLTGSFTVPAGTTAGTKRMRILTSFIPANPSDPCTLSNFGEFEDYAFVVLALTPCSGTPTAATASASATSVCPATSITLTATGLPGAGATGFTYQWRSSPAGANTFTNISSATAATYTFTGQMAATDYRFVITCSNSGLSANSNTASVSQSALASCYCTPAYSTGCTAGDVITNVVLGTLSNNTGATCTNAFIDYTAMAPPSLTQGVASTASVTIALASGTGGVAIWIDYNDNGVFEAGEKSNTTSNISSGATASISITPPINAALGNHRMRVRLVRTTTGAAMDPCTSYANGQAEDYTVNIIAAPVCSGTPTAPTASASPSTACPATSVTLSTTGIPAGIGGFTYQWQSSATGANTFTNIPNATAASYTFTGQTAATDYRLVLTCTNSSLSVNSNTATVAQTAIASCYCTPTTGGGTTYNITNFSTTGGIVNINRTSSGTTGYQSFSDTVSAFQGTSVNYSMTVAGNGGSFGRAIWIDFNNNGSFADAGEQVGSSTAYAGSPLTGSFTVPVGAAPGFRRMRILASYTPNNPTNPCANSGSGEYEDYNLVVVLLPACTMPATQPTALNVTANSATVMSGSFTAAAAPGATSYLVVRTNGSSTAWTVTPANTTTYVAGTTYGNGVVIANTTTTTFTDNSVANNTTYTYSVYAFNNVNCAGGPLYNTTAPLVATVISPAVYTAINTGNWSSTNTWDGNGIPANGCNSVVTIINGVSVNLDVNATVGGMTLNAGSTLTVGSNTLNVCNGFANNGAVNLSGTGIINVGTANTYNFAFNTGAGGSAAISGGTLNVKGQLQISGGNGFVQTGGAIKIDPASATAFLAAGIPAFLISGGTGNNFTGGTITIVNPPHSSLAAGSTRSVAISSTSASTSFGGTHTIVLGDSVSTQAGNSDGFVVETYMIGVVGINNLMVNGGSGVGRWGSGSYNNLTAYGTFIKGNLTINAGSEFRTTPVAGNLISLFIGGNILNNGTLTSQQSSPMNLGEFPGLPTPAAQSITGTGVFQNATTGSTANFRGITLKNGNGVTLNTGGDVSFSGTVTFSAGTGTVAPSRITMTGSNRLVEISGAGNSGAGATNGWVNGFYQKTTATGAIVHTYPVGNATIYAPFDIPAGTVGTAGNIWARTVTGDHPNLSNGQLISGRSVNRSWTVGGTAVFTTAQVRFSYVAADNDATATPANYKIGFYNGSGWTYPAVSGAPTNVQTTSTNSLTNFYGDFAVAEQCIPAVFTTQPAASTTTCAGSSFTLTAAASNVAGYQWRLNGSPIAGATGAGYTVASATAADAGTYTVVASGVSPCGNITSNNAVVVINPSPSATLSGTGAVCKNGAVQTITFNGSGTTVSYTFTYKVNGGANQTVTSNSAGVATVSQSANTAGAFVYTLVSVRDASAAQCTSSANGTVTVTVEDFATVSFTPAAPSMSCGGSGVQIAAVISTSGTITKTAWAPTVGLYTNAACTTAYDSTTNTTATTLYAKNSADLVYTVSVTTALCPATTAGSVRLSVTPSLGTGLADATNSNITYYTQSGSGNTVQNTDCETIATVAPSGASPVSGLIMTDVYTAPAAPTIVSGRPYVPRYYQITPQNNASTATGTITLYALNSDFKLYNQKAQDSNSRIAFRDSVQYRNLLLPLLPDNDTPSTINARLNNILISKESGTSQTGLPGSFTPGVRKAIRPTTSWNSTANRWEMTFATTGFSGFFIGGGGSGAGPLPVTFMGITATAESDRNRIEWNVGSESNVARYEVEKLAGNVFEKMGAMPAIGNAGYAYYDKSPGRGLNSYRVKAVDVDGTYSYSPVATVRVEDAGGFALQLSPNPTTDKVTVKGMGSTSAEATVTVSELSGRMLLKQTVKAAEAQIDLSNLPSGTYMLQWSDGVNKEAVRVTKQ